MIALLTILFILNVISFFLFNEDKSLRYRNWYRPWLLLLISLVSLAFFPKIESVLLTYIPMLSYGLELIFCGLIVIGWIFIKFLLRKFEVNDLMESFLKEHNQNQVSKKIRGFANYLVWPYFIKEFSIFKLSGTQFFNALLWVSGAIVLIAHFWSAAQLGKHWLVLPNALGMILLSILAEWIIYFSSSYPVLSDKDNTIDEEEEISDFYKLYKRYINQDKGFYDSVIFGYSSFVNLDVKNLKEDTDEYLKQSSNDFIRKNNDLIISSSSFTDILPKIAEVLLDTLNKGGKILMIADIPNHTKYVPLEVGIEYQENNLTSIAKLFAVYLEQTLTHNIPNVNELLDIGFYSKEDHSGFDKNIILCCVEDSIDSDLIHSKWMKDLDLKIVFQFNDALADNLSIKRQFSLWLHHQSVDYKTIFFKNYSTGGDEATSNTFVSTRDVSEVKIPNHKSTNRFYFINFALENSIGNLNKILIGNPNEYDLAPGIELAVFPIMENVDHIHYIEGHNVDLIQSKNKLQKLQESFSVDDYNPESEYNYRNKVTKTKIGNALLINNLPFIVRPFDKVFCEDKHLSIIFDNEFNAPKLYKKYEHLGKNEAFICVISKPHLFREYFAENIDYFASTTIESLEPQLSSSPINLCLQLYQLLKNEEVDIEYIKSLINSHSIILEDQSVVAFITHLFKIYLHIDVSQIPILKSKSKIIFKENKYYHLQTLNIQQQSAFHNDIFEYLEKVDIIDRNNNLLLEIPKYLLFQNFLPQQNIIIDGISYDYISYNDGERQLVLRTKQTDNISFNKPKTNIILLGKEATRIDIEESPTVFIDGIMHQFSIEIYESEMELFYSGYYQFERLYHSHQAKTDTPKWINLLAISDFKELSKRKYNTRYIHIKWEVSQKFKENLSELNTRLHQLLYEFLPVLFPHRYQYIQVASQNDMDKEHRDKTPWIFPENNFKYDTTGNFIELFIIEDSFSDLGILSAIQTNFQKILIELYFLLQWMKDDKQYIPKNYTEYVQGKSFYQDKLRFLYYGLEEEDIHWDIELLIDFLENCKLFDISSIGNGYKQSGKESGDPLQVECDYCAQPFMFFEVQVMEDGLHRCSACGEGAVDDLSLAKSLEKEAHELYREHFNLNFNEIPYQFNFVTATEMHHYFKKPFFITNKYDKRECVGLASDREIDFVHVEKFYKKSPTLSIIIHELMHIYQFQKLNYFKLKNNEVELIEGMTTYAEFLLLMKSNNPEYQRLAEAYDISKTADTSEYGIGYRHVKEKYGEDFLQIITKKYQA